MTPTPCPTTSNTCALFVTPLGSNVLSVPQFTQTGQTWSFAVGEMNLANGNSIAVTSSDPAAVSVSPATGTVGVTTFTLTAGTASDAAVKILIQNTKSGSTTEQMASALLPTPTPSPGTSTSTCGTALSGATFWSNGTWTNEGYTIYWSSCKISQEIIVNSGNSAQFTGTSVALIFPKFATIGANGKPLCGVGDICVVETAFGGAVTMQCPSLWQCSPDPPPGGCNTTSNCHTKTFVSGAINLTTTIIDLGPYVQDFVQVDASGNPIAGARTPKPYPYPYQPGGTPPNECEQLAGPSGKPPCLDDTLFNIPTVVYPNSTTNGNGTTKGTLPPAL